MIGFNNGNYQDLSGISIPITSLSLNRGYGAYEFFEVINGKAFYQEEHLNRFRNTLQLLNLQIAFNDQLEAIVQSMIERNKLEHAGIKLLAFPHQSAKSNPRIANLYVFPVAAWMYDPELFKKGAGLVTKEFKRFLPRAKSTDYLAGQYWNDQITDPRILDVLFHNGETIQETSRGNIFAVKDVTVLTPLENVLLGITRGIVLDIMAASQVPFAEKEVPLKILMTADEVFVTSSTKYIMPIVEIDGQTIGNGKPGIITRSIQANFTNIVENY